MGTCGPRRDLKANLMIWRFAKINSNNIVRTPAAINITIVTLDSSSVIFLQYKLLSLSTILSIDINFHERLVLTFCIATIQLELSNKTLRHSTWYTESCFVRNAMNADEWVKRKIEKETKESENCRKLIFYFFSQTLLKKKFKSSNNLLIKVKYLDNWFYLFCTISDKINVLLWNI